MIYKRTILLLLVSALSCLSAKSQTASSPTRSPFGTGINSIISSVDTLRSRMPAEKLYIQFDKPYYSTGDTIWLKAYLFDAAFLTASEKSGIVYIELANDTNKVLLRRMMPMAYGLGMGNIVLSKDDVPEGSYTIRAYTNLMRNFGEDLIFKKDFYVSSGSTQSWLVNSKSTLTKESGKDNLRLAMQLNLFNKEALRMHDLEIRVLEGRRTLLRDKVQTDADGKLDVNFNLPEKADARNISIIAVDPKDDTRKLTIPIPINRPENIDLQFMPEGGNLVNGITSKVGFKAIGEDGKGVDVNGKVFSSSGEVAAFSTSYKGMGSFELTPKEGESYTAKVVVNGITKDFPLPSVKSTGTALKVNNSTESDSIEVTVSISASLLSASVATTTYYLIAQSRGIICYGAVIRFNGSVVKKKLAKSLFPTGIAKFTLMSADRQPLNERIIYIDHHDNLDITINPDRSGYKTRDSIALNIEVKDHEGKPVQGSFSIAVTDDSQVRTDSLSNNILTSLLFTSGLKGTIEDPVHYLQATAQAATPARMTRSDGDLDHLLLTQGWVGYDWKDVFNVPVLQYAVEPEFTVKGRVSNVFNKGSASTGIWVFSSDPAFIKTGNTDKDGSFLFSDFPITDTLGLFLQARNKREKSFNIGIEVDEFKPPVFKTMNQRFMPWYVNGDTTLIRQVITKAVQEGKISTNGTNLLEEVIITKKKIIRDSKNLNGPGEADQILDEKELAKTPKKTLLDLMYEKIKDFNIGGYPKVVPSGPLDPKRLSYRIGTNEIHLVIDGMDVEKLYTGAYSGAARFDRERYEYIKSFLLFFSAEDVQGIEVMYNPRYNSRYNRILGYDGNPIRNDFAYIEITTHSGKGPYEKKMPGTYNHRPMPFAIAKQFYSPKYSVKNPITLADLRSTIHWEPNIVTDKDGKGIVSFYSADRVGTYSIIMEGSDMNGNIGRKIGVINVTN